MTDYQVGDYGIASFRFHKKKIEVGITAFGQIKAIENKVILFEDDCIEYIIDKKKFSIVKKEKPI